MSTHSLPVGRGSSSRLPAANVRRFPLPDTACSPWSSSGKAAPPRAGGAGSLRVALLDCDRPDGRPCSMATESARGATPQWRAAGHAALTVVGRLQVVDSLEVSDISPRDLAVTLGTTSNLLAHHLKGARSRRSGAAPAIGGRWPADPRAPGSRGTCCPRPVPIPRAAGRAGGVCLLRQRCPLAAGGRGLVQEAQGARWPRRGPCSQPGSIRGRSGWPAHMGYSCWPTGLPRRPRWWTLGLGS